MAEMSWTYWLSFDGLRSAPGVSVPFLLVHGDGCVLPDSARTLFEGARGPKRLVWTEGGQIDFYDQPTQISVALSAIEPHFRGTLDNAST